jgi:DNA polymerase sigma
MSVALAPVAAAFFDNFRKKMNASAQLCLIGAGIICMWLPMEFSADLILALLGALTYMIVQGLMPGAGKTPCQRAAEREHAHHRKNRQASTKGSSNRHRNACMKDNTNSLPSAPVTKPDVYTLSALPVLAPTFESRGFDAEVNELVHQLTPTTDETVGVEQLTQYVKQIIQAVMPNADITAFVHGSLKRGGAFSVAVPEIDLVVSATPAMLAQFVHYRARPGVRDVDAQKLKKSAIRLCADQLLSKGGMRFRRSAFRGDEPRMTILVLPELGFFSEGIPVDFAVNAVTPFYNSALLTEIGETTPQVKALVLFVKRWAKDRGICHSAKGHLSPYMWSLLVTYFMQVRKDGPLLPALGNITAFSGLRLNSSNADRPQFSKCHAGATPVITSDINPDSCQQPLGQLFNDFVDFFGQEFDWQKEAVCVRLGQRTQPDPQLPRGIFDSTSDKQMFAPAIEDPFDSHRNLGDCMNAVSLARLHSELRRAAELCENGASLTDLLKPWAPEVEDVVDRDASSDKDA